jgi:leucyl-tRNA---protein transferase
MTEYRKFPEFFVTAPAPCPYLPDREERKLFTHITPEKPRGELDKMLTTGFRRSQNVAYVPYCDSCNACVSVRVVGAEFRPGRTMRKIINRNCDVTAQRRPALPTAEQYALFRRYIDSRHADGGMVDMNVLDFALMVEDSIIDTSLVEYRLPAGPDEARGQLVGVALQDKLSDGLSLVYSFFDPDLAERSLGTFMIIDAIQSLPSLGLSYCYLGYWIGRSNKMNYKTRFQPQERLTSAGWQRVEALLDLDADV